MFARGLPVPETTTRIAPIGARVVAVFLGLVALALIGGGGYLLVLGGSPYYLLAGIACLGAALALWNGRASAGIIFAVFLAFTLVWSLWEAGSAPWPLVARLAGPAVIGLIVALVARGRSGRLASLGVSVAAIGILVAAFLLPHPETVSGTGPDAPAAVPVAQADWLHFGNDLGGSRFSPAADITPANVARLKPAWTFHTGPAPEGVMPVYEAVPIEADGLLTFCAQNNDVIALNAATGKQVWRWKANADLAGAATTACRGVSRHVSPGATGHCAKRIITATLDARMIALDAFDGKPCEGFGQNGQIDLTQGYGVVWKGYYYVTSPPAIVRGKAIVGGWIKDGQFVGEPSGVIRAFDVMTGKLAWAWDLGRPDRTGLPPEGEEYTRGTPNSWAPISADEELGLVYLPMGNAEPDYTGQHRRPFDEKYASSVVALDVETGRPRWVFQTTRHDLWDYDVASQPTLFDLRTPGGVIPALAQGTKRAELFILDRRTGQPIREVTERKVPTKAAPGEWVSPTQPFSTGMPELSGGLLSERRMWGLTPIDQMVCRILFRKAEYQGPLTPIQLDRKTIVSPGYFGGMNWGSVSIDPVRQMIVFPVNRFAMYNQLMTREETEKRGMRAARSGESNDLSRGQPMEGTPYGADITPFLSPLHVPCQEPPFAMVHGVDLRTGKLVWQHPFGTTRRSGPLGMHLGIALPMGVPFSGGATVTASGLMFIAGSQDAMIRALDTRTGRQLWSAPLPYAGQTTPITYKLKGGKQFVVVTAGGGIMAPPSGDAIVAYALEE